MLISDIPRFRPAFLFRLQIHCPYIWLAFRSTGKLHTMYRVSDNKYDKEACHISAFETIMTNSSPYEYRPLRAGQIRIVELLPGDDDSDIYLKLLQKPLKLSCDVPQRRLGKAELEKTLPEDQVLFENPEGRYFFNRRYSDTISYTHPSGEVDPDLYAAKSKPLSQAATFEAVSYVWGSPTKDRLVYMICDPSQKVLRGRSKPSRTANPNNKGSSTTSPSRRALRQRSALISPSLQQKLGGHVSKCKRGVIKSQVEVPIKHLLIGGNLEMVLRRLRYKDCSRMLWIDAICIDQDSPNERSDQVRRMDQVYGLASRVVVWLGSSSLDSDMAIATLEYLGNQIEISNARLKISLGAR